MLPDNSHGGGIIFVLINSHDKHWSIRWGSGHNHTLSSSLQVKLRLAIRQKKQKQKVRLRNQSAAWQSAYLVLFVSMFGRTEAFSTLRKTPVDSTTYLAPAAPQGISAGFMLESESDQDKLVNEVQVWDLSYIAGFYKRLHFFIKYVHFSRNWEVTFCFVRPAHMAVGLICSLSPRFGWHVNHKIESPWCEIQFYHRCYLFLK